MHPFNFFFSFPSLFFHFMSFPFLSYASLFSFLSFPFIPFLFLCFPFPFLFYASLSFPFPFFCSLSVPFYALIPLSLSSPPMHFFLFPSFSFLLFPSLFSLSSLPLAFPTHPFSFPSLLFPFPLPHPAYFRLSFLIFFPDWPCKSYVLLVDCVSLMSLTSKSASFRMFFPKPQ